MSSFRHQLACLLLLPGLVLGPVVPAAAQSGINLPDMGSPSDQVMSKEQEAQIGRMVLRQLREAGKIVEDPLVDEYIQDIGHRLAGHAHDGDFRFRFFVVDDPAINAFAVPGGYIGVNRGLIEASRNESELAGVLAHEIAHVTQRHISRSIQAGQRSSMMALASMIAGVIIGMAGGGDAAMGAIMMGQGLAMEQQIAYTRSNEHEADRIGIEVLASAGFDPEGLPRFFEVLQRRYGPARAPQMLQTHPVTTTRIAEGMARARQLEGRHERRDDSTGYELIKARLRVLSSGTPDSAVDWFEREIEARSANGDSASDLLGMRYGLALAQVNLGGPGDVANTTFRDLVDAHPEIIQFHIGLADSYLASGRPEQAIEVYERAVSLFPRNLPLTVHYSEALLAHGNAGRAHRVLLDVLNHVPPTPEQIRLIALAASANGEEAEAHYYMAEYHIVNGNAPLAMNQLRMALSAPDVSSIQRARFESRIEWIMDVVPSDLRRELERQEAERGGEPREARTRRR